VQNYRQEIIWLDLKYSWSSFLYIKPNASFFDPENIPAWLSAHVLKEHLARREGIS